MSGPDDRPWDPKTRRTALVAGAAGVGLGTTLAALFAAAGADGRAGFAGFLVGIAFGASVGALYAVGSAALDTLRGRPVGRSRLWAGAGLFVLSLACTVMIAGLGG